jgi:hypothetical protein
MATSDLLYHETKAHTCLAGVRVPSTSNRTSFLRGRSAKEAIAVETVGAWHEGKVGGERGQQAFATWPHPPPTFCYAKRRFE